MTPARGEPRPLRREEPSRLVVQPVHVIGPGHGHRGQHHRGDPLRVTLRVGQPERHPPRSAPHQPPLDPEVGAQLLDVPDQVPGGVGLQAGIQKGHRRRAPPAAALVELDEPVRVRVEQPAPPRAAAAARPAVQRHRRLAGRVAAGLPVDPLAVTDVQHPRLVRLDGREPFGHASTLDPSARRTARSTVSRTIIGWPSRSIAERPAVSAIVTSHRPAGRDAAMSSAYQNRSGRPFRMAWTSSG